MSAPTPLHANPGGQLTVDEIVGRSDLAKRLLDILERRSIVLTGERRLGKTTLTTLLRSLATERGWCVVKISVEGLKTLEEFEPLLAREIDRAGRTQVARKRKDVTRAVDGAKVAGVQLKPPTKSLDEIVDAAMQRLDGRLLLVLDELPIFVRTADDLSPGSGTNVLHRLRRMREDRQVRMLMLGSIGFHHTVRDATGVLNDVKRELIGALDADDAAELASRLLAGEGIGTSDVGALASEVAARADRVPYYIHSIIEAAKRHPARATLAVDEIDRIVEAHLTAPAWNMRHFRDRVPRYYGPDAVLATAILDAVANELALDPTTLCDRLDVNASLAPVDRTAVRNLLGTLEDDHYLVADGAGVRSFAFELVRRGWIATGR